MIQHIQIIVIHHINKMKEKNHMITSVAAGKRTVFNIHSGQKSEQSGYGGNLAQCYKGQV